LSSLRSAFSEIYYVSGTSFINVYIKITLSVRYVLSRDLLAN